MLILILGKNCHILLGMQFERLHLRHKQTHGQEVVHDKSCMLFFVTGFVLREMELILEHSFVYLTTRVAEPWQSFLVV